LGSTLPDSGSLTIYVGDWSKSFNANVNACYIEVVKTDTGTSVSDAINGPTQLYNSSGTWIAQASGGVQPYQFEWEIREYNKNYNS
jgi:hypothetical protein